MDLKLKGVFAFKEGMSAVYDEKGIRIPVTVLRYEPWRISQIKTKEKEGYEAVQLACSPCRSSRVSKAQKSHLKKAGFENGARYIREVRQAVNEDMKVGQKLSIASLVKGDRVKVTGRSKGRGFSGAVKRHGFRGGPASHGSKTHRHTGSIGNCAEPGRVMAGRKMPGHYGHTNFTIPNVRVVDVLKDENVILVKGPVPGARNTMVQVMKVS